MNCPHCHKDFSLNKIKQQRGRGLHAEIQCPLCRAWLGKSVILQRLKLLSFYLTVAMVIWYTYQPENNTLAIPIGILALISLLVVHLMDHLLLKQAPSDDDVS